MVLCTKRHTINCVFWGVTQFSTSPSLSEADLTLWSKSSREPSLSSAHSSSKVTEAFSNAASLTNMAEEVKELVVEALEVEALEKGMLEQANQLGTTRSGRNTKRAGTGKRWERTGKRRGPSRAVLILLIYDMQLLLWRRRLRQESKIDYYSLAFHNVPIDVHLPVSIGFSSSLITLPTDLLYRKKVFNSIWYLVKSWRPLLLIVSIISSLS